MKKLLFLLLVIPFLFAASPLQQKHLAVIGAMDSGGLTCQIGSGTQWVQTTTSDNNQYSLGAATYNYQYVGNSTAVQICKIRMFMDEDGAGTTDVHVEIWNSAGSGKVGTNSTSATIDGAAGAWYDVTFATPAEPGANDFRVYFYADDNSDSDNIALNQSDANDGYFGEETEDFYNYTTPKNTDVCMEIWYMQ